MNISIRKHQDSGFAAVEALLILIIIGAVVGIGSYVVNQKNGVKASIESNTATSSQTSAVKTTVPTVATVSTASKLSVVNSTTSDISNLISSESDTEANLDRLSDAETLTNISDSNNAASNLVGAYNENDL